MQLEVITPDKNLFKGEAKSVVLPGIDGQFGILNNHTPMISALKKGSIKIDGNQTIEINGGVVEVFKNKLIVLAD
jgi:F-type H+-transporting ATPase subunit epsilon